jgi:DNA repair exonuclease SbcCD ATPase subunit
VGMTMPIPIVLFMFVLVLFLIGACVRFYRETSLLTENMEFYLKHRTLTHNQDKARMAMYKTKVDKLEKQIQTLKQNPASDANGNNLDEWFAMAEQEIKDLNLKHEKELSLLSQQLEKKQKELHHLREQNQQYKNELKKKRVPSILSSLEMEQKHLIQKLSQRTVDLEKMIKDKEKEARKMDQTVRDHQSTILDLRNELKQMSQQRHLDSRQQQDSIAMFTSSSVRDTELHELRIKEQVAERFEQVLKERAHKDYNDILNLEKQIISMRLSFEGHSSAIESLSGYGSNSQAYGHSYSYGGDSQSSSLKDVKGEVSSLKSLLVNEIQPQMSQYMTELESLAQKLRETRQSFYESELSRKAFASLNVDDIA